MIRFGLGPRLGETPPPDPVAWLEAQLEGPDPLLATPAPSTRDGLDLLRLDDEARRRDGANAIGRVSLVFNIETLAILHNLLRTEVPFRERLVWFWCNHFTASARAGEQVLTSLPSYVRSAIRPHVNGRFEDMVSAVMHHPAMLSYLDNVGSVGPNSRAGREGHRGWNENLARESLELHTVTAASGYTQTDIIEYAKILTGWGWEIPVHTDGFLFRPDGHEPGPKTVLGRVFPAGEEGGRAAMAFLADHPMTHRNLATKLVRHFVADDPPPSAVRRIETVLRDTKGDLRAASLALIALPEAWRPMTKLRSPWDYIVGVLRALGVRTFDREGFTDALAALGEPFFGAPFPNGYPDTAADWASGEDMMRRVDWTYRLAAAYGDIDPNGLATTCLGDLASAETLAGVRRAGSRRDALTLLLASPEFLRR